MLDVLGTPTWMQQRQAELAQLDMQRKVATARIKKLEAENEAVRAAARQTLGQLQQGVQARLAQLQGRYAGDPGIVGEPPGGFHIDPGISQPVPPSFGEGAGILRQPPGLAPLPGGTLTPSIPPREVQGPVQPAAAAAGASQQGIFPAIRGDATTPGQQQAAQLQGMSQAQQAQQAAQQSGVELDPRDLKKLGSFWFWEREGAKGRINAQLGVEKLQLDREGIERQRDELALKRERLAEEQRLADQLQQQIAAAMPQQGQPASSAAPPPGAGAAPGQPERLAKLEAQRAQLEAQRRRLLPFTRMEQGKRAYDAVGSQLDDVTQQLKFMQDEAQEERRFAQTEARDERRFQQSERRMQLSEERAARVESRAAAAAERAARALELQGDSAARAARTGNINAESTLRGDFQQDTKDYRAVRDAWGKVVVSADDPSAAGDLSLIFGYMKLLDPTSVVREGEFATAQNAAGVPERITAQYNRLLSGERLSEATRRDFVDRAKKLYGQYTKDYKSTRTQYRGIAERQGLNPDNVTLDYESTVGKSGPATTPEEQQTLEELGKKYMR